MIIKEIQFRKKREIGDIFSDTFTFIKQEINPISRLVTIYVLPFILLYAVVQVYLQKNIINKIDFSDSEALLAMIGPVYLNIFLFALFGLFVQSLLIATYYTFIEAYVKKGNGNFDLAEITPLLFSNGLRAIGTSFVIFCVVILGLMLCFVPGIYFANTLSLAIIILIFEKKGIGIALLRSAFLVKSQWWNTFLINITGIILIWVANFIMSLPMVLTGLSINIFDPVKTPVEFPDWYWILIGISTAVSSVLYIIPYTFMAFQYFNLDERMKEIVPTEQK
ncbi:MAG TPA: hypothetical protein VLA03_09070 [Draconibacterium sp.]|nr:hypothetical protein [Draconibacterium sp.]